jgi:guanine deaminase
MSGQKEYLIMAIEEAFRAIRQREGGPFGAVVVKDGVVLGRGHNTVLKSHDPTAHAEINAIRDACFKLKEHHLTGAVVYSNFEPCPMCLSAIYWANIREVFYCAGKEVAERIGFMDNHLYQEFQLPGEKKEVKVNLFAMEEMDELLKTWDSMDGKILY